MDNISETKENIPALECRLVKKRYAGERYVLDNLDMKLEQGRITGLLGPNGSGKTTLLKLIAGLLTPDDGSILINGMKPGTETKKIVSYLPERTYLNNWMLVSELVSFFSDFYGDFQKDKAYAMLDHLKISPHVKLKTLSKGTKEKVQLILVMSRDAGLYLLDEPIGGVDPAAREYILNTIIANYNEKSSVLISTHLISDVEKILDDALFISDGKITLSSSVDKIRGETGKSVDKLFREVFKC